MTSGPAVTSVSLLASAKVPPRCKTFSPGTNPAAPTMADITQSAGRAAASATAAGPAAISTSTPPNSAFRSLYNSGSEVTTNLARNPTASLANCPILRAPVSASTRKSSGARDIRSMVFCPIDPVAPSIVTDLKIATSNLRPQNSGLGKPSTKVRTSMNTVAPKIASKRSNSPPWPGIRSELSLIPT